MTLPSPGRRPDQLLRRAVAPCLAIVIAVLAGCSVVDASAPGRPADAVAADPTQDEKRTQGQERTQAQQRAQDDRPAHDRPRSRPERDRLQPRVPTYVVARIIDGDTLELGNGETVRLVGIDTPEVGTCGFEEAGARLAALVLGREVMLGESDEDRDGYGRLLRYVDVAGVDAGLTLVREGLAIARYDSRDGYGFHPREPRYVAADATSARGPGCAPAPVPLAGSPGGNPGDSPGGCAAGFDPCVPPGPPDVDCDDLDGPVRVTGADPHRLDGDGDGIACE